MSVLYYDKNDVCLKMVKKLCENFDIDCKCLTKELDVIKYLNLKKYDLVMIALDSKNSYLTSELVNLVIAFDEKQKIVLLSDIYEKLCCKKEMCDIQNNSCSFCKKYLNKYKINKDINLLNNLIKDSFENIKCDI